MGLNRVEKIDDAVKVRNVLISVSDKRNLDFFVPGLIKINPSVRIYSTGGTYRVISDLPGVEAEKNLIRISDYTGQPEMQGGLVKTLDFKIYLGLLSETYNNAHRKDIERTGAEIFDLVAVNLYPFTETIKKQGSTIEDARSNIDIGGPAMLRASAKNFLRIASVSDPADYKALCAELQRNGGTISLKTRLECAKKTFLHTAEYDAEIARFLTGQDTDKAGKVYNYV